jgi:hypothetical protein
MLLSKPYSTPPKSVTAQAVSHTAKSRKLTYSRESGRSNYPCQHVCCMIRDAERTRMVGVLLWRMPYSMKLPCPAVRQQCSCCVSCSLQHFTSKLIALLSALLVNGSKKQH